MLIYKATNNINGKIYIGQTTKTLEERKKYHKRDSKRIDTLFYRAIRKYGWDNFNWEIIHDNITTIEELDSLEEYYIKLYNCFDNPGIGYNTQSGGNHFKLTEEECQKRSERVSGEKNPMYGKPGTQLGKHFSKEHKKHLSESLTGKKHTTTAGGNNPAAKKVINLNTGEIFDCIKAASEQYKIRPDCICRNIKGQTKTCCGCKWEYYDENKEYQLLNNNTCRNPKKKIYILELDKVCKTAVEVGKILNCDNSYISKKCKLVKPGEYAIIKNYHICYID